MVLFYLFIQYYAVLKEISIREVEVLEILACCYHRVGKDFLFSKYLTLSDHQNWKYLTFKIWFSDIFQQPTTDKT